MSKQHRVSCHYQVRSLYFVGLVASNFNTYDQL